MSEQYPTSTNPESNDTDHYVDVDGSSVLVEDSYVDAKGNKWVTYKDTDGNEKHTMRFSELELQENKDAQDLAPRYSTEELGNIENAATSTENILENALKNGEPRSSVTETDRGVKGVIDTSVPGGSMEATFNGIGEDAELEEIDIMLEEDSDGMTHDIAVKHMDMPPPEIFVDGALVQPQDIPAVEAVIEQIQQEQEAEETDVEGSEEESEDNEREAAELYKALDVLRAKEQKHKGKVGELAFQVQGMMRGLNAFPGDGRGRMGFEDAVRKTRRDLESVAAQLKRIQRTFEENQQEALKLQGAVSSFSGEKLHVVKESSDMPPPRQAERRIAQVDVRQNSYMGDIQQQLKQVIALLEQSAPMNARMLQGKIPRH
ncbi:MAG TPA: hypothetical protein VGE34_04585 [Candidatus Saccharimonadales bacterium]